jgi:hypothetical protein
MNWRFWEKAPQRKFVRLVSGPEVRDSGGRYVLAHALYDDGTESAPVKIMLSSPDLAYFRQPKDKLRS